MSDSRDAKAKQIVAWAEDSAIPLGEKIKSLAHSISPELGTWAMRKVLAANLLDWQDNIPITEKISAADVSSETWYRVQAKPEYQTASIHLAKQIFGKSAAPLAKSMVHFSVKAGDTTAAAKILQKLDVLDKPTGSTTQVNVSVTVEQLEQRRAESQRAGFNRLGFKVPQPVGGDN